MMATTPLPRRRKGDRTRPRVLICTPEITELPEGMGNAANYIRVKGGGMGDISAGLIHYLHDDDRFDVHVVLPKYDDKIQGYSSKLNKADIDLLTPLLKEEGIHLVTDSAFSHLPEVYAESANHPRVRRSEAFQRFIINQLLDQVRPNVVHCNDWMTGLVPAAAKERGIKSLFTLHNVFTERTTPQNIDKSGIDIRRFMDRLYFDEFPKDPLHTWRNVGVDFLASGIFAADMVNTVSETFLDEVLAGEFPDTIPRNIRSAMQQKASRGQICGILNAPGDVVDPRTSKYIENFFLDDVMEKKAINKRRFQEIMALPVDPNAPLFFWPSRLYAQKGPELLYAAALHCVQRWGAQIALVANGDRNTEQSFHRLTDPSLGRVRLRAFDESVSELGKAGADFVLMPSRYEPCGLPQMECPRFGTLPIARLTGGLRDTVSELDWNANHGNGFGFWNHTPAHFVQAVERAMEFYTQTTKTKERNLRRIMKESFEIFSLANTAKKYVAIYERLCR